jgi:hypothetical protein
MMRRKSPFPRDYAAVLTTLVRERLATEAMIKTDGWQGHVSCLLEFYNQHFLGAKGIIVN